MTAPVTLADAVEALNERKDAVLGHASNRGTYTSSDEEARLMFSGSDIAPDAAREVALRAAQAVCKLAVANETDALVAFQGCWLDGVLTGITFARMRARASEVRS